jgi:hypothetical protein
LLPSACAAPGAGAQTGERFLRGLKVAETICRRHGKPFAQLTEIKVNAASIKWHEFDVVSGGAERAEHG